MGGYEIYSVYTRVITSRLSHLYKRYGKMEEHLAERRGSGMSKAAIFKAVCDAGYDSLTAAEIVNVRLAEVKPGQTVTLVIEGKAFTVTRREAQPNREGQPCN